MDIETQFNLVAEEYDGNRKRFIPCFEDFYNGTTDFIAANIAEPKRILDLGAGTGLLSYFWQQYYPNAQYMLVDIADDMLAVARKRFAGLANFSYHILDYAKDLPEGDLDVVMSALSIHHLENEAKQILFERISDRLPHGGVFVNYDQFCADQPEMSDRFDHYWENQLLTSGLTEKDIALWQERRKLDRECSVSEELTMLRRCSFREVQCVYSCQKFAVIAAVK